MASSARNELARVSASLVSLSFMLASPFIVTVSETIVDRFMVCVFVHVLVVAGAVSVGLLLC
jgi:hypothetical protein